MQLREFDTRSILLNLIKENTKVIDSHDNRSILLIKEALHVNHLKPLLNTGLKLRGNFAYFDFLLTFLITLLLFYYQCEWENLLEQRKYLFPLFKHSF